MKKHVAGELLDMSWYQSSDGFGWSKRIWTWKLWALGSGICPRLQYGDGQVVHSYKAKFSRNARSEKSDLHKWQWLTMVDNGWQVTMVNFAQLTTMVNFLICFSTYHELLVAFKPNLKEIDLIWRYTFCLKWLISYWLLKHWLSNFICHSKKGATWEDEKGGSLIHFYGPAHTFCPAVNICPTKS